MMYSIKQDVSPFPTTVDHSHTDLPPCREKTRISAKQEKQSLGGFTTTSKYYILRQYILLPLLLLLLLLLLTKDFLTTTTNNNCT